MVARGARRVRTQVALAGRAAWRGLVSLLGGDDLTHAASVAYCGLLSLFPAFLLAFAIFGAVAAREANRAAVIEFILRYFPTHFEFRQPAARRAQQTPLRFGVAGGIALVWAALGVFSAVTSAVNHAWGVEKPRSYLKHKLFSFLMLAAAFVILLAALVLVSVIQIVHAGWFATVVAGFPQLEALGGVALRYATTLMLIVVVGLIYYFVPNAKVRLPRRVARRHPDRAALARRARGLLLLRPRHVPIQPGPRLDRGGRRLPHLGVHLRGRPDVRRGVHGRVRPAARGRSVAAR